MKYLRAVRTLLSYLLIGLPFLVLISPSAPFIYRFEPVRKLWLGFDRWVCSVAHGTKIRTISGYTGARIETHKRFAVSGAVIDFLAILFGDDKNHCLRADVWEVKNNLDY